MKKNKTNLILALSILLLLVLVSFFVYFLQVIKNKNKHISAVNITLQEKIIERDNRSVLQKRILELVSTYNKINEYFVDSSSIDKFVGYLENIGSDNGVDLSVKGVDIPKGEKNKISINININGSFSNVTKVVALLENAPYDISINSLYLNKEIIPVTEITPAPANTKIVPPQVKSQWQANVTFIVLSI